MEPVNGGSLPVHWFTSPMLILALSVTVAGLAIAWWRSVASWHACKARYMDAARRLRSAREAWITAHVEAREWKREAESRAVKARVPTAAEIVAKAKGAN